MRAAVLVLLAGCAADTNEPTGDSFLAGRAVRPVWLRSVVGFDL